MSCSPPRTISGKLFDAGMTQTIMSNGGDITAFVAGGEGISEHGALAKNEGLATGEGPADVGKTKKKERKVKGRLKSSHFGCVRRRGQKGRAGDDSKADERFTALLRKSATLSTGA